MKHLFITICFVCWAQLNWAQNPDIDSLKELIIKDKADKLKVDHLNDLCFLYTNISENDKAKDAAHKAIKLAATIGYVKGQSDGYNYLGNIFSNQGDYPNALTNQAKAYEFLQISNDKIGIISYFNSVAIVYYSQGNYPECLKNYFSSLKLAEELGETAKVANTYNSIGLIYCEMGDNLKALTYCNKGLDLFQKLKKPKGIAFCQTNLSIIYTNLGKQEEALDLANKALIYYKQTNNEIGVSNSYTNIGAIHFRQKNYTIAIQDHLLALSIYEQNQDLEGIATSQINLGQAYTKLNKVKDAYDYLNKALRVSEENELLDELSEAYASLFILDSIAGNYKAAFEHHKLHTLYKDSVSNEETKRKSLQASMQYEYDKKELATKIEQEKKDAIVKEEKQKQNIIIAAVIVGLAVAVGFALYVVRSLKITRKQKEIIEHKRKETEEQKELIEEKHKEITDSINYAERIQRSFLATKDLLDTHLKDYFVLFQPKDVVSGDFYWASAIEQSDGKITFALVTADSTGHGVPGAIMSLLNITSLESALHKGFYEPGEILNDTRKTIIHRLKKDGSKEGGKDGMDASLVIFDFQNQRMRFAAANNPVWVVREIFDSGTTTRELIELKPDKMPVGKHDNDTVPFQEHEFELQKGDVVYTLTDGLPDQFGGPKGKKFMYKQLKELLVSLSMEPMDVQHKLLLNALNHWKGDFEQVDDVCVIGVRVG